NIDDPNGPSFFFISETLRGHEDWSGLLYDFRDRPEFAAGAHGSGGDYDGGMTYETYLELRQIGVVTVTNVNDTGPGSLRAAIDLANSRFGPDTIIFTVAGTIDLSSPLPALNDPSGGITIAGGTAPGYVGTPVVVLRGPGAASSVIGLQILSAHNKVL